jgi:hypothetical protein
MKITRHVLVEAAKHVATLLLVALAMALLTVVLELRP